MPKTRAQKIKEGLIPPSQQTVKEQASETARMIKAGVKRIVSRPTKKAVKPRKVAKNSRKY